jgi:hypothetical protein
LEPSRQAPTSLGALEEDGKMYLELITTVTAVQNDLANAYASSGRMREIGQYFLVLNRSTIEFFKYVEPPKALENLHKAFITWQKCGAEALQEELETGKPNDSDAAKRHVEASQAFAQALAEAS